ncbi:hypothetical protein [Paracoccus aminophilus]|uniref:DUF3887 domain-containing protein n=1 Tax=Paracoccus aminophilus JCM 7686 TaxID=1367847 RepID=S5YDU9_PARAH|nr:hypothetical protein [Paracoccus aminophilus]AGT09638.1 hypothetical protein JCM7686_2570 [Paracoccus aminophilus JCM 7686]
MSILSRLALAPLAVALLTAPAFADEPPCALNGLAPLPVLEKAKAAILAGDYSGFYRETENVFPQGEAPEKAAIGPLQTGSPKGFDSCSTILRRTDPGGMVQEITLYTGLNKSGRSDEVAAFYLVTAPLNGETKIIVFSYNGQIAELLGELR